MKTPLALLVLSLVLAALIWKGSALFGTDGSPLVSPEVPRLGDVSASEGDLASAAPSAMESGRTEADARAEPTPENEFAVDAATGSLLLRAALTDGTPVSEVRVYVTPRRGARIGHGTSEHITDDDGLARARDLDPGPVSIFCSNGPYKRAEVVAGQETEVLIELGDVVEVHGVVRDPGGQPVAGADVWLASWRRDWLATIHMTRTGSGGEFVVRNLNKEKSLGATADGFGPSELVDLDLVDTEHSPVEIVLVLVPEGGGLDGRVVDPAGRPVPGARVAVGKSPDDYSMRNDGTVQEFWSSRVETTDESGRFAFTGLEAGAAPLHVLALDYPEYEGEVEIPIDGTAHVEVQLTRGMNVRGVVMNEAGEPVPDAIVMSLDAPFVDPFPTQGPTEPGAPFHRPATRSDDAGVYLLDRLPPGGVHLYASKGTSYWGDGDFIGTVQETLAGTPGETLEWNPVLSLGRQIRGRVTFADGEPMGNVFVSATDDDERRYTENADEEGRFAIPGLENRAYMVSVQFWSPPDGAKPLEQEGVWPSESELLLTASLSKVVHEKGTVSVRIDDGANRIDGKGAVVFAHQGGWYYSDESDGVFSTTLPPNRYQARAMSGDLVVGTSEWFDLGPGEDRDLGSIATRGSGTLVVRVRRSPEMEGNKVFVSIETDYGPRRGGREFPDEDELTFEDLLEGEAKLTLGGPGVAIESRTVDVQADTSTTVEFELRRAHRVAIHVSATPSDGFGKLEISLRHPDGELYATLDYYERWGARLPVEANPHVPPGRFVVTATTTSGLTASGEIVMDPEGSEPTLNLELE